MYIFLVVSLSLHWTKIHYWSLTQRSWRLGVFLLVEIFTRHPSSMDKISYVAPAGQYSIQDTVLELEFQGIKKPFTMLQTWPVRTQGPLHQNLLPIHLS